VNAETPDDAWPPVSVVMPVLNEEQHLHTAVSQVLSQDYPGELELVIALGASTDRTDQIAKEIAASDERIRLISNPLSITPAGLNAAIQESQHDIVVRVDGHGILSPGYIKRAVEVLRETGADNVGGTQAAKGETPFEQAVARAYTSPLGLGGGRYHVGGVAGPVDSVYLGVFRREILERLGGFDERFVRAQDWELNYRIRQAGGVVWFSPDLQVTYRPRKGLWPLAKQFFKTGQWRRMVLHTHPGTASFRYLAPPLALICCAGGLLGALTTVFTGVLWQLLGLAVPGLYIAGVIAGSVLYGRELPAKARLWLPVVVATMHMTWGAGFLLSRRSLPRR
jgi:succinoglycan biosynthesis protein ExoA